MLFGKTIIVDIYLNTPWDNKPFKSRTGRFLCSGSAPNLCWAIRAEEQS